MGPGGFSMIVSLLCPHNTRPTRRRHQSEQRITQARRALLTLVARGLCRSSGTFCVDGGVARSRPGTTVPKPSIGTDRRLGALFSPPLRTFCAHNSARSAHRAVGSERTGVTPPPTTGTRTDDVPRAVSRRRCRRSSRAGCPRGPRAGRSPGSRVGTPTATSARCPAVRNRGCAGRRSRGSGRTLPGRRR